MTKLVSQQSLHLLVLGSKALMTQSSLRDPTSNTVYIKEREIMRQRETRRKGEKKRGKKTSWCYNNEVTLKDIFKGDMFKGYVLKLLSSLSET